MKLSAITPSMSLKDKSILLIISGGIAAYKSLELIRLIKKSGGHVRCILTKGGEQFVTPLSVSALSEEQVYTNIWNLKDETEMGHIRLSREADLIIVAPASADILAKITHGQADDLATTTLLAADKPVMIAPAMNQQMWNNPATKDNIKTLKSRGLNILEPATGEMACGETGQGRMIEAIEVMEAINNFFFERPLKGQSAIVTAGPTHEQIDPVRFIGNNSSGKQGYAVAEALRDRGASVTLITGPTALPAPHGINTVQITSAAEMLKASEQALPTNIAVCAAAVSDWTPTKTKSQKIKKKAGENALSLELTENPDILKTISNHKDRPQIVIGFAAETENLLDNAKTKLAQKGCDIIVANDVGSSEKVFGADENHVYLISHDNTQEWPRASKQEIARKLVDIIGKQIATNDKSNRKA